ncbi:plastocyanin/azurin family copper-binding protein [Labrenzia sp. PHM005]|uniref:plastocyanin/azurin family copper-binding protein n=1 Tax=Labrenzia sp. PHM005 TaxID=2590016 RepID=UPI0011400C24|nr:plastocyanin/azurin family copper-binding protein [Labrenzia sp. PHM005]QDG76152.1 hypothetical protein FJ695_09875 [Labrenzia sp. PHM005]
MSRHHQLTAFIARGLIAALKPALALSMCAVAGYAMAAMSHRTVDQITNFSVSSASGMFQFAPNLVRIEPGETLTFLNSRGAHTVKSQKGFWPEGAPEVDITGQLEADVVFDTPGLYGVTCRRHGKYGMVMLVAVGDVEPTQEDYEKISKLKASKSAKDGYQRLMWELHK